MRMRIIIAGAAAAVATSGCTIIGGPGYDPVSGSFAVVADVDDDGVGDGIVFGCVADPAAEQLPACHWQGIRPLGWWPLRVQP